MQSQAAAMPNPALIYETFTAQNRSAALRTAVELEVFTAVGEGNVTPESIAKRIGAAERGTRILCDALVVYGLLTKEDGRYGLTADTAFFLDKRSRAYMGDAARFLGHTVHQQAFNDLTNAVRHGGTVYMAQRATAAEDPMWVEFARGMAPMAYIAAQRLAAVVHKGAPTPTRVLDIAAGHGMFGIAVAQANTEAHITAVDWPGVLAVARENAERFGVADRYETRPGSFFEVETGGGYDLALLTNFLHHLDRETGVSVLRKVRKAVREGGTVAAVEFVPNEDRVSPAAPAEFALTMLAMTEGGDAYTFAELQGMFAEAGFANLERHEVMPGHPHTILLAR